MGVNEFDFCIPVCAFITVKDSQRIELINLKGTNGINYQGKPC